MTKLVVEHDMTLTRWGHNYVVQDWESGTLWVWQTPPPALGDILLLQGKKDVIRAEIISVEQMRDPNDMYLINVKPSTETEI
jgi:hypothetical protein